jgi:thioesterase domain-containing protein/acyl carrier protein
VLNPESAADIKNSLCVKAGQTSMAKPSTPSSRNGHGGDEITRQLSCIWCELLGLSAVEPDQNYFDLGGDSMLAVQMFAHIETVFQVKLPLASLFEAPTIRDLAAVIRREADSSAWTSLVAIQPLGTRPAFFCVHGAGGNVLIYQKLAQYLGKDQPFYGFQSQGLDGSCDPLTRVEDMASLYVQNLRAVQPRGPYFLGGYCLGGTIAYEMARQLSAAGEEVALLALFDTMNWCKIAPISLLGRVRHDAERIVFHTANFLVLNSSGKLRFLLEKMNALRVRIPVWRGMLLDMFHRRRSTSVSSSLALARIWMANDKACVAYIPKPYSGAVTDFQPQKQYHQFRDPGLKWHQLAQKGQRTVVLNVSPAGMLVEPFVRSLATALRAEMDLAVRSAS